VLKRAALTLDTARSKASRAGWPLALSRKEFAQLEALLRAERARVANEDLIEQVRDEHTSHQTNAIRVTPAATSDGVTAAPVPIPARSGRRRRGRSPHQFRSVHVAQVPLLGPRAVWGRRPRRCGRAR
jgi:hypothetical protein